MEDSRGFQPMSIVSSSQVPGGLATCAKSRAAVFVCGLLVASTVIFLSAYLGLIQAPNFEPPPPPPSEWTVQLNLAEDEVYAFESDVTVDNHHFTVEGASTVPENRVQGEVTRRVVSYEAQKLCGDDVFSYVRVEIKNFTVFTPPAPAPSPSSPSVSPEILALLSGNGFEAVLQDVLMGHTFTAKLAHSGTVLRRDGTNIRVRKCFRFRVMCCRWLCQMLRLLYLSLSYLLLALVSYCPSK